MSRTVLIVAIGPVQQFIGQARRMRDLWFGSHILSEMCRGAACSLAESGWSLVFPALAAGDIELSRCDGAIRPKTGVPPLGIANKIVATRQSGDDVTTTVAVSTARIAAANIWKHFAKEANGRAKGLIAHQLGAHESPEAVIESFLEVIGGWSTYEADGEFESARLAAEQAVAARKVLRDFRQWQGGPRRKSSLDGQRESILVDRKYGEHPSKLALRFRLSPQEHLDAIGMVKRAGGDPDQFVPIARVAVEPWLKALDEAATTHRSLDIALRTLEAECEKQGVPRCQRGVTRWLRGAFLYDGEIFFEGQWPALSKELGLKGFFDPYVKRLFRANLSIPEPYPYVACLHADGDRMGKALGRLGSAIRQSRLSEALAKFSQGVRDIVEEHSGLHIYAGGDDVVAILPVLHAANCAEALRAAFIDVVQPIFLETFPDCDDQPPTLSVGIGIAHFLKPLGNLLGLAREAESFAKQGENLADGDPRQRNALGVIFDKRSGDTIKWRAQWGQQQSPGRRLNDLVGLLSDGRLPRKLPYEIRKILKDVEQEPDPRDRIVGRTWRLEVLRILARKRPEGTEQRITPEDIGLGLPSREDARVDTVLDALRDWVDAAMIASALADAERNVKNVAARGIALEIQHGD
ncbi:type III-B CRISPR-associated protein Cas10/Cmr2 [uncultured Thiodictyon sp.]|uniref:type III-B CRISPR-associated protein Cas10/Cmr2 n=1 Tax=uncultured Thiodictyon sp. TaxID=1846217 RepID=UPI0025F6438D|nr:type III-B CRISPR-associated protein Cas10/Cmr2 [uncultured Thiodictyon sp.]